MKPGLVRILMAGLVGLALLGLVLDRSRMVDADEHYRYLAELSQIQELEVSLNEMILRARHAYLNNYDPLVGIMNRLRESVEAMGQVPRFFGATDRTQLQPLIEGYGVLHKERETLVENFKSDNAVLHNSLSFFPLAISDMARELMPVRPQLADRLQQLARDILIFNLYSQVEMQQRLEHEVGSLRRLKELPAGIDPVAWQRVLRHAEVILEYKKELDHTTSANLNLPTRDLLLRLQNRYQAIYLEAMKSVGNYRLVLYLMTIVLGAGMAYSMIHRYNATVALRQINAELEQKVRDRTAELERVAMTDELTGLYTRRFIFEWLRKDVAGILRTQGRLGCLMLDIDHFKKVNDSYGHLFGDEVLRRVAHNIRDSIRAADIAGRFGGEEFIVLLPEASTAGAVQVAEKIRRLVAAADGEVEVTISVGVAMCDGHRLAADHDVDAFINALLQMADEALYRAKKQGRNQVVAAAETL